MRVGVVRSIMGGVESYARSKGCTCYQLTLFSGSQGLDGAVNEIRFPTVNDDSLEVDENRLLTLYHPRIECKGISTKVLDMKKRRGFFAQCGMRSKKASAKECVRLMLKKAMALYIPRIWKTETS